MADTEFITARFPEGEMPKTQTRKDMMHRVADFVGDKSRLREAGGTWGPWQSKGAILDRVDRRTARMGVGPKLIVQRDSDRAALSIREVDSRPKIPDLNAHPNIELGHALVWDRFDVRSGGVYVCRFIDGTHTVTRHGYVSTKWKGAAEDIFVLHGGMEELERVAHFIVDQTQKGPLDAQDVIVNRSIWTPQAGWHAYTGDQHFHVHWDVLGGHPCSA